MGGGEMECPLLPIPPDLCALLLLFFVPLSHSSSSSSFVRARPTSTQKRPYLSCQKEKGLAPRPWVKGEQENVRVPKKQKKREKEPAEGRILWFFFVFYTFLFESGIVIDASAALYCKWLH